MTSYGDKLFESKKHVPPPYASTKDLTECPQPGPHFVLDKTGDGSSKFAAGFWRRLGEPCKPVREADQEARAQRARSHDAARLHYLDRSINRNGFNPVSGEEYYPPADNFKPRGPAPRTAEPSNMTRLEETKRMRDTSLRFFRVEDPSEPRIAARAVKLTESGLINYEARRKTADLGFGRPDLPSQGVADAFGASWYGGAIPATDAIRAACTSRRDSAGEERSVWDLQLTDADLERRRAATQRAPNRIFDTTSMPVVLPAMPDVEARAIREERDLRRSRPPRPADRPDSFTATATRLSHRRVETSYQSEVDMVRALKL